MALVLALIMDKTIVVQIFIGNRYYNTIQGPATGFFPFGLVFKYLTNDGKFIHVITEVELMHILGHYKLPITLIAYSRTANKFIYNEIIQFSDNMVLRFKSFMQFIYSLIHPKEKDLIEIIYYRKGYSFCNIS